jgi:hypothetical protein
MRISLNFQSNIFGEGDAVNNFRGKVPLSEDGFPSKLPNCSVADYFKFLRLI